LTKQEAHQARVNRAAPRHCPPATLPRHRESPNSSKRSGGRMPASRSAAREAAAARAGRVIREPAELDKRLKGHPRQSPARAPSVARRRPGARERRRAEGLREGPAQCPDRLPGSSTPRSSADQTTARGAPTRVAACGQGSPGFRPEQQQVGVSPRASRRLCAPARPAAPAGGRGGSGPRRPGNPIDEAKVWSRISRARSDCNATSGGISCVAAAVEEDDRPRGNRGERPVGAGHRRCRVAAQLATQAPARSPI